MTKNTSDDLVTTGDLVDLPATIQRLEQQLAYFRRLLGLRTYLSIKQAAHLAGVSGETIRRICEERPGFACKTGGRWMIDRASFKTWLNERSVLRKRYECKSS